MMNISVCDFTKRADEEVEKAIRAINRQIAEDFVPYWSMDARALYLWDRAADVPNALPQRSTENRSRRGRP